MHSRSPDFRRLINLIESADNELVSEIERGGYVDSKYLDHFRKGRDFSPRQLDLFPEISTTEPDVSADPKLKLEGRLKTMWVASKPSAHTYDPYPQQSRTYFIFDKGKPIAYVAVQHPQSPVGDGNPPFIYLEGEGRRVISVYIDPEYRKTGLALDIYEWLLRNVCDYLLPDTMHTPGGEHIWKSMLKAQSRFDVQVFDPKRNVYRRRRPGKDFEQVYQNHALVPFVTLPGKAERLIYGDNDDE